MLAAAGPLTDLAQSLLPVHVRVLLLGVSRICRTAGNSTRIPSSQGPVLFPGDGADFGQPQRAYLSQRGACHHGRGKRERDPDVPCGHAGNPCGPLSSPALRLARDDVSEGPAYLC